MMTQQRATAFKATIDDVANGEYVTQEAPHPNYLNLYGERVRRIQLIAVLVQKSSHHFVLDDSTGQLTAKRFDTSISLDDIESGDPVLVIGRPRSHDNTVFLGAEAVNKLNDSEWITAHKQAVDALYDEGPVHDTTREIQASTQDSTVNYTRDLLSCIKDNDDGEGAPTADVVEASQLDDPEEYIDSLINEGEIFEIRPGRLKVL
mgnify:CR=1 FL=1